MCLALAIGENDLDAGSGKHHCRIATCVQAIEVARQNVLRCEHDGDIRGSEFVRNHPGLSTTTDDGTQPVFINKLDKDVDVAGPIHVNVQRHIAIQHTLQSIEIGRAVLVLTACTTLEFTAMVAVVPGLVQRIAQHEHWSNP